MQHTIRFLAGAGALMLMAGAAVASADNVSISSLPDQGPVTVAGTVTHIWNDHDFTLHDNTGSIHVKLSSTSPTVIKQGDKVTVSGQVESPFWGLLGKDISASNVDVHKDLSSVLSDTLSKVTGVTVDKAENVQIGNLPSQGMVQVSGIIDSVSDPQHFTVKDPTGSVDVSVQSGENVVVAKGSQVTVTGYIKDTMLSKKIEATHVILTSSAPVGTNHSGTNID